MPTLFRVGMERWRMLTQRQSVSMPPTFLCVLSVVWPRAVCRSPSLPFALFASFAVKSAACYRPRAPPNG